MKILLALFIFGTFCASSNLVQGQTAETTNGTPGESPTSEASAGQTAETTNGTPGESPTSEASAGIGNGAAPPNRYTTPSADSVEYEMKQRKYYDEGNRRLEKHIESLLSWPSLRQVKRTNLRDVLDLLYRADGSADYRIKKFANESAYKAIYDALPY